MAKNSFSLKLSHIYSQSNRLYSGRDLLIWWISQSKVWLGSVKKNAQNWTKDRDWEEMAGTLCPCSPHAMSCYLLVPQNPKINESPAYVKILKEIIWSSSCDLKLKQIWVVYQGNDLNYPSKVTSEWLKKYERFLELPIPCSNFYQLKCGDMTPNRLT